VVRPRAPGSPYWQREDDPVNLTTHGIGDDLGPEKIVLVREPRARLEAVVVVDNVACGPAIGGVRMAPDVTVDEVFRLARAMTYKNAAANLSSNQRIAASASSVPARGDTAPERIGQKAGTAAVADRSLHHRQDVPEPVPSLLLTTTLSL
jgi:hypothetical protein